MVSYAAATARIGLSLGLALGLLPTPSRSVEWKVHPTRLPGGPVSDQSSTLLPLVPGSELLSGDAVVLAGGCSSPTGNAFVDAAGNETDYFACDALTAEAWAFDPSRPVGADDEFVRLADMPRERYRHAAVAARGKLVLVGGRTAEGEMIGEIDVYDPVTDSWSTPASISLGDMVSDNAAFTDADGTALYVVGGYQKDYTAVSTVFTVDLVQLLDDDPPKLNVRRATPLGEARGDIHAVTSPDGKHAYVAGGFHHLNDFCVPLKSAERYDFEGGRWTSVADLEHERGDTALVQLGGKIYAIGGETRPADWCDDEDAGGNLRDQSAVLDDVEVLDPAGGDGAAWMRIDDIPNARFRFAAAAWEPTNAIYTFGGQEPYDADCMCHATSDVVVTIDLDESPAAARTRGPVGMIAAVAAGIVSGLSMLM